MAAAVWALLLFAAGCAAAAPPGRARARQHERCARPRSIRLACFASELLRTWRGELGRGVTVAQVALLRRQARRASVCAARRNRRSRAVRSACYGHGDRKRKARRPRRRARRGAGQPTGLHRGGGDLEWTAVGLRAMLTEFSNGRGRRGYTRDRK